MFSTLLFDTGREPLQAKDLGIGTLDWVQTMGGWAAFALLLWLLFGYPRMRAANRVRVPRWQSLSMTILMGAALVAYVPLPVCWIKDLIDWARNAPAAPVNDPWNIVRYISGTVGGLFALLAILFPLFANLPFQRMRRIGALARLSFKEALSRRVLYAFLILLLVPLFGGWFIPHKPETEVSIYVNVMFTAMTPLLCTAAALIAAFSIPTDLKQQTIHTIVTKPVERFEIVLGRFLGFTALLSLVLIGVTLGLLIYLVRGVDPLAAEESLKARDPLYGQLIFQSVSGQQDIHGINVGREWDYRSHISSGMVGQPQLFALWRFESVPSTLAHRDHVRCEFGFDIYRTTKGQENEAIPCRFSFYTRGYNQGNESHYRGERDSRIAKEGAATPDRIAEIEGELVKKYGYYEVPSFGVVDYHTQYFDVPGGVFDAVEADMATAGAAERSAPPLAIRVEVLIPSQYVGMAKHDLYLRMDDPDAGADTFWFAVNFCKAAFTMWLLMVLVIGVAVSLSTMFSGPITFLLVVLLFSLGVQQDFIKDVANNARVEGPGQALYKMFKRESGVGSSVDDTAIGKAAQETDVAARWVFRRFLDVIPEVPGFDLTSYPASGFNIPMIELVGRVGLFLGTMFPWLVLAFYLLRWREIAGPL
jgi:hypothetical protein